MTTTICRTIVIQAPIHLVWDFVGTQAGLRRWWKSDISMEAKEGGHCEETGVLNGIPYHRTGKVIHYMPPHQLRLTFQEQNSEVWPAYLTIAITLEEVEQHTRLIVEQNAPLHALHAIGAAGTRFNDERLGHPGLDLPMLQRQTGTSARHTEVTAVQEAMSRQAAWAGQQGPDSVFAQVWEDRLAALQANCFTPF